MADFSLMTVLRADMTQFRQGMRMANSLMGGYGRNVTHNNKLIKSSFNSAFLSIGKTSGGLKDLTGQMFAFSGSLIGVRGLSYVFSNLSENTTDYARNAQTALTEVSTISNEVYSRMGQYNAQMLGISSAAGEAAADVGSAYYEIVSAGHNGAAGLNVLRASSVAAVGGLTETKTAADGITNVLNAWKLEASESARISDVFFKGVEKGKTRFDELASGIADVSPVASKLNIGYEDLIESSAALTAQGTPTSVAFTQIASAIAGISKEYGSGIFAGKTFREVMIQVYQDTGGSYEKLLNKLGRKEGVSAVMALGGGERSAIMGQYNEFFNGLEGATSRAFDRMAETTAHQLKRVNTNISNYLMPASQEVNKTMGEIAAAINKAFDEGRIDDIFENITDWAGIAAGAILVLKAGVIATNLELGYYAVGIQALTVYETASAAVKGALTTATRTYNLTLALTGSTVKAVTAATRAMWITMSSNPLTAVIAAMGLLTAAYFAFKKEAKSTDDIIQASNNSLKQASKLSSIDELISEYEALQAKQELSANEQERYNTLVKDLSTIFPDAVSKMNEYGDAVEINSDKVKKATAQQKADLLQSLLDQKEINDKKRAEVEAELKRQEKLTQTSYTGRAYVGGGTWGGGGQWIETETETTAEGREAARKAYEEASAELQKLNEAMRKNSLEVKKLQGDYISVTAKFPELFESMKNKTAPELDEIRQKLQSLSVLNYDESDLNAIQKKIQEIKTLQDTAKGTTEDGFNAADFRAALNKQKELYEQYEKDIEVFGKAYADKKHEDLIKQGFDFEQYLNKRLKNWVSHQEKMSVVGDVAASAGLSFDEDFKQGKKAIPKIRFSTSKTQQAPNAKKLTISTQEYKNPFKKGSEDALAYDRALKELNRTHLTLWETMAQGDAAAQIIGAGLVAIEDEFIKLAETGQFSFESLAIAALKSGQQIVNQLLVQAIAGLIAGESSKGIIGLGIAAAGITAMLAMFANQKSKAGNISALANGGVVYGDTLVRVGEYSGASSNPEVIAPLDKLKTIMAQNAPSGVGLVEFEIRGDKLIGVLNNYNRKAGKMR